MEKVTTYIDHLKSCWKFPGIIHPEPAQSQHCWIISIMPAMHGPSTNTCQRDEKGSKWVPSLSEVSRMLTALLHLLPRGPASLVGAWMGLWTFMCKQLASQTSKCVGSSHLFHLKKFQSLHLSQVLTAGWVWVCGGHNAYSLQPSPFWS